MSKEFIEEFEEIKEKIDMIYDKYDKKYIEDSFVVVAATNDKQINHEIGVYCNQKGKLVNVVDFVGANCAAGRAGFLKIFFVDMHCKRAFGEAVALASNRSENGGRNAKFLGRERSATVGFQNFNGGFFILGVD